MYSGSSLGSIFTVSYSSKLILSWFWDDDEVDDDEDDIEENDEGGDGGATGVFCFGDDLVSARDSPPRLWVFCCIYADLFGVLVVETLDVALVVEEFFDEKIAIKKLSNPPRCWIWVFRFSLKKIF